MLALFTFHESHNATIIQPGTKKNDFLVFHCENVSFVPFLKNSANICSFSHEQLPNKYCVKSVVPFVPSRTRFVDLLGTQFGKIYMLCTFFPELTSRNMAIFFSRGYQKTSKLLFLVWIQFFQRREILSCLQQ